MGNAAPPGEPHNAFKWAERDTVSILPQDSPADLEAERAARTVELVVQLGDPVPRPPHALRAWLGAYLPWDPLSTSEHIITELFREYVEYSCIQYQSTIFFAKSFFFLFLYFSFLSYF